MPRLNALRPIDGDLAFARGDLRARANAYRDDTDRASEEGAFAAGGAPARQLSRINNLKARTTAQNNPEWDEFFQSIRDVGDGRAVKLLGGPSPDGSNQITGLSSQRSAGSTQAVQGGPFGVPDSGPYGDQPPDRGPYTTSDNGPYGNQPPDRGPYTSMDALHGRVRPMLDSHDVWRAKTRLRIYGEEA